MSLSAFLFCFAKTKPVKEFVTMSFIVRKNGIYMIKSGRGVDRRIFVSGADYCFVIFKRKR